jgi:hypothetical protein
MAEERIDPGGNTEQWRAFAHAEDPVEQKKRSIAPIVLGVVVVVLVLAALALLAFM